jgi:hypothetical protein
LISFAVVGHHARIVEATSLAHSIGGVVTLDDGSIGASGNHLRAWDATTTLPSDWACVLEDDAVPVDGFVEQAERALACTPERVVSFYLGRSRPPRWQERIAPAIRHADRAGSCWITTVHAIHAVAIAIHADLREDWLDFARTNPLPIDERMSAWCVAREHRVAYSWPSLVDHADGPTLIEHRDARPRDVPRVAWRTGTREYWTTAGVSM